MPAFRSLSPALVMMVCVSLLACGGSTAERRQRAYDRGNSHFDRGAYREAIIEYRRALQADGRFADARRRLGEAFLRVNEPGNALREFVNAADLLPRDVEVQLKAASLLLLAGDHEACRRRAAQVLEIQPDNVNALLLAGSAAAGLKDLDGAFKDIERAIAIDPTQGRAYANLAFLQLRRGRKADAEAAFARAQALAPSSVEVNLAVANYHWTSGRAEEAEADLRGALEQAPNDPRVNQAMATFYLSTGRAEAAGPYLEAVARTSTAPEPSLALADYYVMGGKVDRAVDVLNALKAERKALVEATARLAVIDHTRGKRPEAHAALDELLQKEAGNARLLLLKGRLLFQEGKVDAAAERINAAVQAEPRSAAAKYLLGLIQSARGERAEAVRTFNEVLSLAPNALDPLLQLSRLYLAGNDANNAAQSAEQAVRADARSVPARIALVRALIARRELAGAISHARQATTLAPRDSEAQALLGTALALRGERPEAREAIERALVINRGNVDAVGARVALDLADARQADAKRFLDGYQPASQKNVGLLLVMATGYERLGDRGAAEAVLRRAIDVDPSSPLPYSRLGSLYAAGGRLPEARREFDVVCRKAPDSVPAHTMLAVLHHLEGNTAAARAAYEKVLGLSAVAPVAANNLAWLYAEEGNLDRALELARTAKQSLPEQPEVSDTLGWVYYRKNLHELAVAEFQQSVERDADNPLYHYHLGLAHARLGSNVPARKALERALALSATFDGADDARRLAASLGK